MNAVGLKAVTAAEKFIKKSQERNELWKWKIRDGTRSSMGCLQLYSDNAQVSLKGGSLAFYQFHIKLFSFSEEWRRRQTTSGSTICGYLPGSFAKQRPLFSFSKEWRRRQITSGSTIVHIFKCLFAKERKLGLTSRCPEHTCFWLLVHQE